MANQSYIVSTTIKITRKAGDTGSIVFTAPTEIVMTYREALFQVRDNGDDLLFSKSSENSDEITIVGQTITVPLANADTAEASGTYYWDLQVMTAEDAQITTIGSGTFVIQKEYAYE